MAEARASNGADLAGADRCGARWHVVYSQPHKELYAARHLTAQGYQTFTPQLSRMVRHARKTQSVLRPLFARYIFISFDPAVDYWRPVLGTFGVTSMIMNGERPRPVPRGVVEALIAAYDGRGGYDFRHDMRPGDPVRFLGGAFAEQLGELVTLDDAGRVGVLLDILGARRVVSARVENLIPATL